MLLHDPEGIRAKELAGDGGGVVDLQHGAPGGLPQDGGEVWLGRGIAAFGSRSVSLFNGTDRGASVAGTMATEAQTFGLGAEIILIKEKAYRSKSRYQHLFVTTTRTSPCRRSIRKPRRRITAWWPWRAAAIPSRSSKSPPRSGSTVYHSGTVGAAREAAIVGLAAIAVSIRGDMNPAQARLLQAFVEVPVLDMVHVGRVLLAVTEYPLRDLVRPVTPTSACALVKISCCYRWARPSFSYPPTFPCSGPAAQVPSFFRPKMRLNRFPPRNAAESFHEAFREPNFWIWTAPVAQIPRYSSFRLESRSMYFRAIREGPIPRSL